MKIKKILSAQLGAAIPYITYTPSAQGASPAAMPVAGDTSSGSSSKDSNNFAKDILSKISSNGIPSDVNSFMEQLSRFMGGIDGKSIDELMATPQGYQMIASKLSELNYNKEQLIETRKELTNNGGLGEVAITTNGALIGTDKDGNLKSISIEEYAKNKDKIALLTNNELLQMRAYSPNGAFNSTMISVLQNGEGMKNVQDGLNDVIKNMKLQKQKGESFVDAKSLRVLDGIEGIQGIVKVGQTQESSRVHAQEALEFLYSTLPQNQRNLLRAKGAQMGMDPDKGALELIKKNIIFATQENNEIEYDLKNTNAGSEGGSSGAVSDLGFSQQWVRNRLGTEGLTLGEINTGGKFSIYAPSMTIGTGLTSKSGEPIDRNASVGTILQEAFNTIADGNNVYWGDQKVSFDKMDNLVSTGKPISKAYLPIDLQYYQETGEYKPDLEIADRISKAEKEIKSKGITTDLGKLEIYNNYRVGDYISQDGKGLDISNTQLVQPFGMIQAIGQGRHVVDNPNPLYLNEVERTEDTERLLNNGKYGKNTDENYLTSSWNIFAGNKDIYEGTVFFHTTDNLIGASLATGNLKTDRGNLSENRIIRKDNEAKRQADYKTRNFSSNSINE